jgi:four helix bundle protein
MDNGKKYLMLNDLKAYKISFDLSNHVWKVVIQWKYFSKDTVGKQFVRAVDSISANIAEGFGRYNKKDKIKFYKIARGSVYESLDWLQKSKARKIIEIIDYDVIFPILKKLPQEINHLINYTERKLTI